MERKARKIEKTPKRSPSTKFFSGKSIRQSAETSGLGLTTANKLFLALKKSDKTEIKAFLPLQKQISPTSEFEQKNEEGQIVDSAAFIARRGFAVTTEELRWIIDS